jgi:2-methylcitrate dehydratase PrpD
MALARELAIRIADMRYEQLPAAAVYGSRIAVMDTIGCMLAGANEDAVKIIQATLQPTGGPCAIIGSTDKTNALDAALVNGTAAHALDYDNGSNTMGGHASATMVPALLAAAEAFGGSGKDVVLAHTVGFEVGTRLGLGVNFHHYEKGWHPTSTLGTFAVIGACASLLKLSVAQTEMALGIGTSLASGIKANFGTMTKPMHVGHCARNGLFAVLLARSGYTASAQAFEHKQGFFNVFNGAENYDESRILEHWATPLQIVQPGAGYKQYPCCAATHAALDATLKIVARHGGKLDAHQIAKVETWTPARRLAHTNRPDPASNLDAKFSVQYCVARALLEGEVVMEHFEGDAWRDERVGKLTRRVQSTIHLPGQFPADNHFGAEVRVTFTNGETDSERVDIQLGRTADNPIPASLLRAKFENCAACALPLAQVKELASQLDQLEELASIREICDLLIPKHDEITSGSHQRQKL